MALADLTNSTPAAAPWRTCLVCHVLDTIPPAEAAGLRALLADPTWRYVDIREAIAADPDTPLDLPLDSLARHAKGRCAAREKLR